MSREGLPEAREFSVLQLFIVVVKIEEVGQAQEAQEVIPVSAAAPVADFGCTDGATHSDGERNCVQGAPGSCAHRNGGRHVE